MAHSRRRIELYLRRSQMSESRFGRVVANDSALVSGLRAGREPREAMVSRITAYLDKHKNGGG